MTWFYSQKTGILRHNDTIESCGYSGKGEGKNNPAAQFKHNFGPIPRGEYQIGSPHDTMEHGPCVLQLLPSMDNKMFGRSGFLIHGDSLSAPGMASEGCVILNKATREAIVNSGDNVLEVTE